MTHEEFMRLNPIICTTYGFMGYNTHEAMLMQGKFLATRTFILDTLDRDEAELIRLRYGIGNQSPMKVNDIAEIFGCSTSKVKDIELKAIRKLRHPTRIKLLREFTDENIDRSLLARFEQSKSL